MKKNSYTYIYLSFILASVLLWILGTKKIITPYYLQIFILICINIILTLSLNIVNGFCGQFSVGHAGFMAIGAYFSCIFTTLMPRVYQGIYSFQEQSLICKQAIFIFSLLIGAVMAGLTAYLVGLPILSKLRGDYLAICTLAFGEVIRSLIRFTDEIGTFFKNTGFEKLYQFTNAIGGPRGLVNIPKLTNVFWVVGFTIITIIITKRLIHSSYGRAWVGIREDEIAAEMMGVNTSRYKVLAFALAGFFAGLGGGLYAHLLMFIHPDNFSFAKSIEYLVYLYLGGMGSIIGSIAAASGMTFLLEFLRIINLQEWRMVIYPLILVIIMLTRSEGLFKKEL